MYHIVNVQTNMFSLKLSSMQTQVQHKNKQARSSICKLALLSVLVSVCGWRGRLELCEEERPGDLSNQVEKLRG